MKLSYNEKTGELIEKSMSGNEGQSKKLKQGANVIVATPGQLVHEFTYHKDWFILRNQIKKQGHFTVL